MVNDQLLHLAQEHLMNDLTIAEDYLRATIDAHNLASQFERLIHRNPVDGEERAILYDVHNAMSDTAYASLRLFDSAAGRIDRTPRGYGASVIWPTFGGYLADARKRMDSLKQGKLPITGPTIDARTAGFDVSDGSPLITPLED